MNPLKKGKDNPVWAFLTLIVMLTMVANACQPSAVFAQAAETDIETAESHFNRSKAKYEEGFWEEAISGLDAAVQLDRDH